MKAPQTTAGKGGEVRRAARWLIIAAAGRMEAAVRVSRGIAPPPTRCYELDAVERWMIKSALHGCARKEYLILGYWYGIAPFGLGRLCLALAMTPASRILLPGSPLARATCLRRAAFRASS